MMTSELYGGHWTSVDSGRSSAAVFSPQSLPSHETGARDASQLDHMASDLEMNDTDVTTDNPSLKPWLPTMQDLLSPSNSSGSGENFGHPLGSSSDQQAPKLFPEHSDELESQLIQLKLDCNTLRRQNKQLKERCQYYRRLNDQMKSQMKNDANGFFHKLHESLIEKIVSTKQKKDDRMQDELERKLSQLQKENAVLRERIAVLDKEVDASREFDRNSSLLSKDYFMEIAAYKDELMRIRQSFEDCERKRQTDLEKWRENQDQVTQLSQLMDRLQKELEEVEEHKVLSKLATAMEQRVQLLEESLQREREDRATGLSKVEERLLLENAKLQISEKEAQRHWNQTLGQLKVLENKYQDLKNMLEESEIDDDVITTRRLSDVASFTRAFLASKLESVDAATDDSVRQQVTDLEAILKQRSHEFLLERNLKDAQLQNLHDINDALKAENQCLRSALKPSQDAMSSVNHLEVQAYRVQIEALKAELNTAVHQISQLSEANEYADDLVRKLQEITARLEKQATERGEEKQRETGSIRLAPFVMTSARSEHESSEEQPIQYDGQKLVDDQRNTDYGELLVHLMRSKMAAADAEFVHTDESERLALEGIVEEKDSQLLKLNFACDELRTELDFAKKAMSLQLETSEKQLLQVEQLRNQLRQQIRLVESLSSTEEDLQLELKAVKQRLASVSHDLLNKEAELKSIQLLNDVTKANDGQTEPKSFSSWNQTSSVESEDKEFDFDDRVGVAKMSAKLIQLQYEKHHLTESIQKANCTIESLVHENAELKHFLQLFHQQLTSERSLVCRLTYDKMAAQQQFYAVDEECEAVKQSKERLEAEAVRHETNSMRLASLLDQCKQQTSGKLDSRFNKVCSDLKRASGELRSTKHLLSAREKDVQILQNTIEIMLKCNEVSSIH